MNRPIRHVAALVMASTALAGCASMAPEHVLPEPTTAPAFDPDYRPDGEVVASQLSYRDWFVDPRLEGLIANALENNRDLLAATDYPPLDVDHVAKLFKEWEHHKVEGILTYRDRCYPSTLTGTMSPVHHTIWMKALDDSLGAFLKTPEAAE